MGFLSSHASFSRNQRHHRTATDEAIRMQEDVTQGLVESAA